MKKNYITINTDASFHPEHKVGGYAFYIRCDLFKIQKGGMFKNHPSCSQDAEIMAIGNAFATLLAQKEIPDTDIVIVNTDCMHGVKEIKAQKTDLSKSILRLTFNLIQRLATGLNTFEVTYKHVKAHNGTPDARSWVNDWCDKTAKQYMRQAVALKTGKAFS